MKKVVYYREKGVADVINWWDGVDCLASRLGGKILLGHKWYKDVVDWLHGRKEMIGWQDAGVEVISFLSLGTGEVVNWLGGRRRKY